MTLRTWMVILAMAFLFLAWGSSSFLPWVTKAGSMEFWYGEGCSWRIGLLNGKTLSACERQNQALYGQGRSSESLSGRFLKKEEKGSFMNPKSIVLAAIMLLFIVTVWGCDYGRMKDQEALQTYKTRTPERPDGTVPLTGGLSPLKEMDPKGLLNPLPFNRESARREDGLWTLLHHVPRSQGDGHGTVGQSFYPLPTDLKTSYVQNQADGTLFYTSPSGGPSARPGVHDQREGSLGHHPLRAVPRRPKRRESQVARVRRKAHSATI